MSRNIVEHVLNLGGNLKTGAAAARVALDDLDGSLRKSEIAAGKAGTSLASMGAMAKGAAVGIGVIVGALGAMGAAMYSAAQKAADLRNELGDTAGQTGLAVDTLAGLRHAARATGAELTDLTAGLRNLPRVMRDASQGIGTAGASFAALGVELTDSTGSLRDADDVFKETMEALQRWPNEAERAAMATDIFSRSGVKLTQALGDVPLEQFIDRARTLGADVGPEAVANAQEWQASVSDLNAAYERLTTTLSDSTAIGDHIDSLTGLLVKMSDWVGYLDAANRKLGELEDALLSVAAASGSSGAMMVQGLRGLWAAAGVEVEQGREGGSNTPPPTSEFSAEEMAAALGFGGAEETGRTIASAVDSAVKTRVAKVAKVVEQMSPEQALTTLGGTTSTDTVPYGIDWAAGADLQAPAGGKGVNLGGIGRGVLDGLGVATGFQQGGLSGGLGALGGLAGLGGLGALGAGVGMVQTLGQPGAMAGMADALVAQLEALPDQFKEIITEGIPAIIANIPDLIVALVRGLPEMLMSIVVELPLAIARALGEMLGGLFGLGGNKDRGWDSYKGDFAGGEDIIGMKGGSLPDAPNRPGMERSSRMSGATLNIGKLEVHGSMRETDVRMMAESLRYMLGQTGTGDSLLPAG